MADTDQTPTPDEPSRPSDLPEQGEVPAHGHEPGDEPGDEPTTNPYGNLWVPLLVVPAGIVMVLVCVFLFFGAIGTSETSLTENLGRVVHGGANEREQALLSLVVQVQENQVALDAGREPPWQAEPTFLDELRAAWNEVGEDDAEIRITLASLQAQLGDEEGVTHLIEVLGVDPSLDPGGKVRFTALFQLGAIGDERARGELVRFLDDPDSGLRSIAAVGLKRFSDEETRAALRGCLGDEDLIVRGNAALSLAAQGDDAGALLLLDMLDPALYEAERKSHERRFSQGELISECRRQAVEALGLLRRPEDRARLQALADEEQDLAVREAALRALNGWDS
jgi:HEAT repeat protein